MQIEDKYLNMLHQYWGYADSRDIQRDIIESIGQQKDTLGLIPTGRGKSITSQVPALVQEGACIMVTPLIASMKDQVQHPRERGIQATAIYLGMSQREITTALDNCVFEGTKLLYILPERIGSELFLMKLRRMNASSIIIDEAHCISQWGYDLRPACLQIANVHKEKPDTPLLTLTATATPKVIVDIQERPEFKERNVFHMSFERENLTYAVRNARGKNEELVHILSSVRGCAIVYVRSRKRTREIAEILNANNITATFCHAGLEPAVKGERQTAWQDDAIRVIVATNAFGTGIDRPGVRIVVHTDCPDSLEAYFQEAGRAGRNGNRPHAVLLYDGGDERKLDRRIVDNFPEKEHIKNVYQGLAFYYEIDIHSGKGHTSTFDIGKFYMIYKYFPVPVNSALHLLARAGYLVYETDPDSSARFMFLAGRNELYKLEYLIPYEEKLPMALLRNYGGLFTDYVYVDEGLLTRQAELTREQMYLLLHGMTQRCIVHSISQRKMPFITYTRNHEEIDRLIIPTEVHEQRREECTRRVRPVINYAKNDEVCRSKQFLHYFGETDVQECIRCDVCLEHYTNQASEEKIKPAQDQAKYFLNDREKHHLTEPHQLSIARRQLNEALEILIAEEEATIEGSYIFLHP